MGVSREKLYEEIWAEPMTTVATRYGVSSNFLARVCERLNIPRPTRGYWAQRESGIELELPDLPAAEPGQEIEWGREGEVPHMAPLGATIGGTRRSKEDRPAKHPLLVGARAHFEKTYKRSYDDIGYLRPLKSHLVDIFVSKDVLTRALEAANDLFLSLEDRGQRVILAPRHQQYMHKRSEFREGYTLKHQYDYGQSSEWKPGLATLTFVGEMPVGLTLFELSEEVEVRHDHKLNTYVRVVRPATPTKVSRRVVAPPPEFTFKRWMPTGRLGLHAYAPHHRIEWERYWYEKEAGELPKWFERIGDELERSVDELTKLHEQERVRAAAEQREWDEQKRKWAREEEAQKRAERDKQMLEDITARIQGYRMARDVREYVSLMQKMIADAGLKVTPGGHVDEFIARALAYADKVDPLVRLREDIEKSVRQRDGASGQGADHTEPEEK